MNVPWLKKISGLKIERTIKEIAYISSSSEGKGRFALGYSATEDAIFHYLREKVEVLNNSFSYLNRNLDTYDDAAGNLYITLDSDKEEIVACGSHVDSVPNGGDYDGVMGVAAGLEVLRVLFENNVQMKRAFRLIVFRAEEGAVSGQGALGSAIATGQLTRERLEKLQYSGGSFRDFMVAKGYDWKAIGFLTETPIIDPEKYRCYLEFHIEQGRVLTETGAPVGVVEKGIGGATRWLLNKKAAFQKLEVVDKNAFKIVTFKIKGRADHSGGTPMNGFKGQFLREDALCRSAVLLNLLANIEGGWLLAWESYSFAFSVICSLVELKMMLPVGWRNQIAAEFLNGLEFEEKELQEDHLVLAKNHFLPIADFILTVEKEAVKYAEKTGGLIAATVGGIKREEDGWRLLLDVRILAEDAGADILKKLSLVARDSGMLYETLSVEKPAYFHPAILNGLKLIHKELFGKEAFFLPSMPGHDARNMAKKGVPTGMIFAPCREGVSHSPEEFVKPVEMETGARLLAAALVYFANRAG